jgi:hypothetical protein
MQRNQSTNQVVLEIETRTGHDRLVDYSFPRHLLWDSVAIELRNCRLVDLEYHHLAAAGVLVLVLAVEVSGSSYHQAVVLVVEVPGSSYHQAVVLVHVWESFCYMIWVVHLWAWALVLLIDSECSGAAESQVLVLIATYPDYPVLRPGE